MSDVFGVKPDKVEPKEPESYLINFIEEGKDPNDPEYLRQVAEGLAKKAVHADKHIETILNEKTALQSSFDELAVKVRTTDELMTAISQTPSTPAYSPEPEPVVADPAPSGTSLTEEDLESRLEAYEAKKNREKEINNKFWSDVTTGLNCTVDEARARVFAYVGDDDSKKNVVSTLGASDPGALVKILQDVKIETFTKEPTSPVPPRPQNTKQNLTWSYVKKMRKENPALANSWQFKKAVTEARKTNPDFHNT